MDFTHIRLYCTCYLKVNSLDGWGITNVRRPNIQVTARYIELRDIVEADLLDPSQAMYWVAPSAYLGNRVTSYGGKLIYTVTSTKNPASSGQVKPDVRLEV